MNVVWSKSYEDFAGEMWSLRPVSDSGFIIALSNVVIGYGCSFMDN